MGLAEKLVPFLIIHVYESAQKYLQRLIIKRNYIFKNLLNIHWAFSIGTIIASPRYIKIGIPKVKQAPTKKTKRQNKALPLFDFSRPLQTPKNQAPFLVLMIDVM